VAVKRGRVGITIFLLLLLGLPVAVSGRDIATAQTNRWTATDPPINFAHIETGEVNRRGEAVGYHHRPNGIDPPRARVLRVTQSQDANGVYRARVALRDPATGQWIDKRASSTFFPDAMSDDEVIKAVLNAFHDGRRQRGGAFVGSSGHGFMIQGWYQSGRIVAAYPLRGP
jgi:EndoU nuclease-like protein